MSPLDLMQRLAHALGYSQDARASDCFAATN